MPGPSTPLPIAGFWHHTAAVGDLVTSLYRLGRAREASSADASPGIADVSSVIVHLDTKALDRVVSIDVQARTAFVESRCPVWRLAEVCLSRGLIPACVPTPATLTVGGALVRTSVGANSLAVGTFAECVEGVELLTSSGHILWAARGGPRADLFAQTLGGRGKSGFVIGATVRLEPASGFVATDCLGVESPEDLAATLAQPGEDVHFAEALVRGPGRLVASLGRAVNDGEASFLSASPSRYLGSGQPYSASLVPGSTDLLTTIDYLRRWDADEFWHSADYGMDRRLVRTLWPAALRKPEVFARLDAARQAPAVRWTEALTRWRPGPARVYREVAIPLDRIPDFLTSLWRIAPGVPAWIVPVAALPRPDGIHDAPAPASSQQGAVCGIWGPGAHLPHDHHLPAEAALDRLAANLGGFTIRSAH
ncbi:MAG: FAD-binding protein [Micrococcales bacterium]|nr:FAD-binding protein [Micrococcales bacterium]